MGLKEFFIEEGLDFFRVLMLRRNLILFVLFFYFMFINFRLFFFGLNLGGFLSIVKLEGCVCIMELLDF